MNTFIRSGPLLIYFAVTFAISWGGVLAVIGPGGFTATRGQFETLLPAGVLAMVAGPGITGIMLTGLVCGRPGLREPLSRLLSWRVGGSLVRSGNASEATGVNTIITPGA